MKQCHICLTVWGSEQMICPICLTVWGSEQMICPICLTELQDNEYSSEDADDGVFADPYTDADIIDDLAHDLYVRETKYLSLARAIDDVISENAKLRGDNIRLIHQMNGRTK